MGMPEEGEAPSSGTSISRGAGGEIGRVMSGHEELVRRTVGIPVDLREFLAGVGGKIERGEHDAVVESDDLLQADGVYGGRWRGWRCSR